MDRNRIKLKISLIINIIIVILTVIASVIMFTGFRFMYGYEIVLESTKLGMLRFFTVDSNMFMGIVALLFAIDEINVLQEKRDDISINKYILKLMGTSGVGLTFLIVFTYLGQISEYGLSSLLMNSNLFFHLIIPIFSILNFIIFEKTDKMNYKYTFYGIIPTVAYAIYYLSNILYHMENGEVSVKYDWYWFVQNGIWTAVIVAPTILVLSYVISYVLWILNKNHKKKIP
ncbi:MAG: hypothetical protein IKN65_04135 [Clostridia bacterium]|nr:hypothetical protein [Clostridia bacterium]